LRRSFKVHSTGDETYYAAFKGGRWARFDHLYLDIIEAHQIVVKCYNGEVVQVTSGLTFQFGQPTSSTEEVGNTVISVGDRAPI
jgi:hypothetical protein